MSNQHKSLRHYAILIGIDAYLGRPLSSCVRDVNTIKNCLKGKLTSVNVQAFTAGIGDAQPKLPHHWPTCHNIVLALENVTSIADPGSYVYIHFSGHGTRLDPVYELSNQSTGDLALVLLDGPQSPDPFLRGPRLAGLVSKMLSKGLVVTVVLDCCFSGSVYRKGDCNVRYVPHRKGEAKLRSCSQLEARDATMRDNWLLDPEKYTILAACGPHENAKGGFETSANGESYGALSYFLSKTLSNYGLSRRHRDIHRHLCSRFWECSVAQNPVLYGNQEQGFFGTAAAYHDTSPTWAVNTGGKFQLRAGAAHGFGTGDHFKLTPFVDADERSTETLVAQAANTRALNSEIELLGNPISLERYWLAEPLTWSYLKRYPIRLDPALLQQDDLLAALKEQSLQVCGNASDVAALQVVMGSGRYTVLDASGQHIKDLSCTEEAQIDVTHACEILKHLARFLMIRDIANEDSKSEFQQSFRIRIKSGGRSFGPGEVIEVRHGGLIELEIENTATATLYAHVYDLDHCWRAKGILCCTYEVVPTRDMRLGFTGTSPRRIRMTVPPVMKASGSCEDIIKVFVTSQPTSFDLLELPGLDEIPHTEIKSREIESNGFIDGDWEAFSFQIRTKL